MAAPVYRRKVRARPALLSQQVSDPRLNVVASPTDPYVPQFRDDTNANAFKALSGLLKGGVDAAAIGTKEAREAGAREWNPGTPENEDSFLPGSEPGFERSSRETPKNIFGKVFTGAYQSGYDRIQGERDSNSFYNEAYEAAQRLATAEPGELDAELTRIRTKYMSSMVSDDQLDAFLPKAAAAEERLTHDHKVNEVKRLHRESGEAAKGNMRIKMEDIIAPQLGLYNYVAEDGSLRPLTLSAMREGFGIETFLNNKEEIMDKITAPLNRLHGQQMTGLGGNFTKAEITGMYVDLLNGIAIDSHTPELLDAVKIKGDDGLSIQDRNSPRGAVLDDINRTRDAAESRRWQTKRQLKTAMREQATEDFNKGANEFVARMANSYKLPPAERAAVVAQAEADIESLIRDAQGFVGRDQASSMYAVLRQMQQQGSHAIQTNPKLAGEFWLAVSTKRATPEWVIAHEQELDPSDFNNYLSKASEVQYALKSSKSDEKNRIFGPRQRSSYYMSKLPNLYNPRDPWGTGFLNDQGLNNLNDVSRWISQEAAAAELAKGGMPLDDKEWDDIVLRSEMRIRPWVQMTEEDVNKKIIELQARGDFPGPTDEAIKAWWPERSPQEREAVSRKRGMKTPATPN